MRYVSAFVVVMMLIPIASWSQAPCVPSNVTASVELLGNPAKGLYPGFFIARNPWDLQLFDGKIFIGHGDLEFNSVSGIGGQAPILFWDIAAGKFGGESFIKDEAIYFFRFCGTRLCFAGSDATTEIGLAYDYVYFRDSSWSKYKIQPAQHVLDLLEFNGKDFASANVTDPTQNPQFFTAILMSDDGGMTWTEIQHASLGRDLVFFFQWDNRLYADIFRTQPGQDEFYVYDPGGSPPFQPVPRANLLPNQESLPVAPMIGRPIEWQGSLVYLRDLIFEWDTSGLWVATSFTDAHEVTLPANARARDLIKVTIQGKQPRILVLTSTKQAGSSYRTAVFESIDLTTWRELFWFTASTFARSFEYDGTYFYFGLGGWGLGPAPELSPRYFDGGDIVEAGVPPDTGNILRLAEPPTCSAVNVPALSPMGTAMLPLLLAAFIWVRTRRAARAKALCEPAPANRR